MSTPNPNHGHGLSNETITMVQNYYESDDISRVMPGKKDCISVKVDDRRILVQKRLLLGNLKEVYQQFKDQFPAEKIGFSRFAELRPKHCVLAGASGTHAVCVCTIHQNTKLMMVAGKLAELTAGRELHLQHYYHCIALVICNPPQPACYLRICQFCPGISQLKDYLNEVMDDNYIDSIQYKQWVSVDRSTLETITKSADDFVDSFCDQIKLLIPHSFIAKQQSLFQTNVISSLLPGQFIVIGNFSENYSFVLHDAAQGFHWNNSQATIHPFVAYYRESGKLEHISYVVISDCLHHDTIDVHLFQRNLVQFLQEKFLSVDKILYFSDGSAAQYKNRKNFVNLCHHKEDFGIQAEWHFYATSHGKGPCDGIGVTVKRLAAKASLQRACHSQFMTPSQLFDWAIENIERIHFKYCTIDE